ncbi:glycosyltransferase [Modestobacter marinus]|uniref:glycosyltransferase n=1 Tax=Modestobacter marinus TaxID=477641 RepID=UPI001C93B170|nr:glycosyltransferase [Modestobacter marinus]
MTVAEPSPVVSVVMPFWDAVDYFDDAIASVLAQTHADVELLLCDDGSAPASTAIAQRWAAQQPSRVRYLEHRGHAHRGTAATRDLGLAAATGELVAFLDADDVWAPEHLAHEVALLRSHPEAGLVCGQAFDWFTWDDPTATDRWLPTPWPSGTVVSPPGMLTAILRRGAYCTPTCSLLIRRSLLPEAWRVDGRFTTMFEDQALLATVHTTAPAVISGSRTAYYRQHPGSTSARAMRDGTYHPSSPNASMERFLRWLETYLPTTPTGDDPELRAALEAAMAPYERSGSYRWSRVRAGVVRRLPERVMWVLRGVRRRARSMAPVRMGSLRHVEPLSRAFGYDRGGPIDRFYIERFLQENSPVIAGRVLEVGDAEYTRRFGGDRVTHADVLNVRGGFPETTFVADLADAPGLPSDAFDCVVLTQVLQMVYDLPAAARTLHRILRPGGVLLATFPGISPIGADEWAATWYWALTPLSASRLMGEEFGAENVEVRSYGNVLTSVAFLEGIGLPELRSHELEVVDPQFPMLIAVRANKPLSSDR